MNSVANTTAEPYSYTKNTGRTNWANTPPPTAEPYSYTKNTGRTNWANTPPPAQIPPQEEAAGAASPAPAWEKTSLMPSEEGMKLAAIRSKQSEGSKPVSTKKTYRNRFVNTTRKVKRMIRNPFSKSTYNKIGGTRKNSKSV